MLLELQWLTNNYDSWDRFHVSCIDTVRWHCLLSVGQSQIRTFLCRKIWCWKPKRNLQFIVHTCNPNTSTWTQNGFPGVFICSALSYKWLLQTQGLPMLKMLLILTITDNSRSMMYNCLYRNALLDASVICHVVCFKLFRWDSTDHNGKSFPYCGHSWTWLHAKTWGLKVPHVAFDICGSPRPEYCSCLGCPALCRLSCNNENLFFKYF